MSKWYVAAILISIVLTACYGIHKYHQFAPSWQPIIFCCDDKKHGWEGGRGEGVLKRFTVMLVY
jgi:hypothetical protein